jgi:hypothetical protein
MSERSAFDHRPDPELGQVLQSILAADDDAAFVEGVLARAAGGGRERELWDILGVWARPGVAAAGVLAAAAVLWLVTALSDTNGIAVLEDPLQATGATVPSYVVSEDAPNVDAVMTLVFDNE